MAKGKQTTALDVAIAATAAAEQAVADVQGRLGTAQAEADEITNALATADDAAIDELAARRVRNGARLEALAAQLAGRQAELDRAREVQAAEQREVDIAETEALETEAVGITDKILASYTSFLGTVLQNVERIRELHIRAFDLRVRTGGAGESTLSPLYHDLLMIPEGPLNEERAHRLSEACEMLMRRRMVAEMAGQLLSPEELESEHRRRLFSHPPTLPEGASIATPADLNAVQVHGPACR